MAPFKHVQDIPRKLRMHLLEIDNRIGNRNFDVFCCDCQKFVNNLALSGFQLSARFGKSLALLEQSISGCQRKVFSILKLSQVLYL
jgi:hypothetical protein